MKLYHATKFETMKLILSLTEAEEELDEVNGFSQTRIAKMDPWFAGKACFSSKPLRDFHSDTYYIAVIVPYDYDIESCRYDDDYDCDCYAIPVADVNSWRMFRYEVDPS